MKGVNVRWMWQHQTPIRIPQKLTSSGAQLDTNCLEPRTSRPHPLAKILFAHIASRSYTWTHRFRCCSTHTRLPSSPSPLSLKMRAIRIRLRLKGSSVWLQLLAEKKSDRKEARRNFTVTKKQMLDEKIKIQAFLPRPPKKNHLKRLFTGDLQRTPSNIFILIQMVV